MPRTTALAYLALPSAVLITAASCWFFMLPSSMRIGGYWARFKPAKSARTYRPFEPR